MSNLNFLHSGGNKVTLSAPASNPSSDITFKLPQSDGSAGQVLMTDGNGNLSWVSQPTNTPAFSVYRNGTQSISHNTYTKVQYNTENFDTDNTFDNSTNYRFTPAFSGKSYLVASIRLYGTDDFNNYIVEIHKNGTAILRQQNSHWHYESALVSGIVTHDTNDYFEVFVMQQSGSSLVVMSGSMVTYFMGYKLIE